MEHSHNKIVNAGHALRIGIIVNVAFVLVEVLYGFISNSAALLADAGHNFGDVLALGFSLFAVRLSQRKPTLKFTYGFRRSTILVALLNTIILLAAVVFIFLETVEKLNNPAVINARNVIVVAAIGIAVNGFTAWLFMKGDKHDLNIRTAFVHFLADTLVSLGVVAAGIVVALTGIYAVDPIVSFIVIAVILYSSYHLLVDAVNLALDGVPGNIDIQGIRQYLENLAEVAGIHDLHIWALSTTDAALTVHLVTNTLTDTGFITSIQHHLHSKFNIEHTTIQVEFGEDQPCRTNC